MKPSKQQSTIWDYDTSTMDLSNPETKIWYLTRKLNFGDFSDLKQQDIKHYLPQLNINPTLKQMLKRYLISL